jgi:hypothetical protein
MIDKSLAHMIDETLRQPKNFRASPGKALEVRRNPAHLDRASVGIEAWFLPSSIYLRPQGFRS